MEYFNIFRVNSETIILFTSFKEQKFIETRRENFKATGWRENKKTKNDGVTK